MTDSANVELVRSIYADWERGDFTHRDWADPEMRYRWADGPEPHIWKDPARMREDLRDLLRTWQDMRMEPLEYRELDGDRVLVLLLIRARAKRSQVDVARLPNAGAHVFQLCDSKVVRLVFYMEAKHALADLGLAAEREP